MLLNYLGIPYWGALVLAPIIVGITGVMIERLFISRLYHLDHLYGLLLTFGLALVIEGLFRREYGILGAALLQPAAGRHQSRLHVPALVPRRGSSSSRWSCASAPGS